MENNKEPAFPITDIPIHRGLTKREFFAAMALQGLLSNSQFLIMNKGACVEQIAVESADLLIRYLEK